MTDRQINFAAELLKHRHALSKVIIDDKLLDENVLNNESTKQKVMKACGITPAFFKVLMRDLKMHKFIVDGSINHRYIPKLQEGSGSFAIMLYFDIEQNENGTEGVQPNCS